MKRVRITGGPSPTTAKVVLINADGSEGEDITDRVIDLEIKLPAGNLWTANVTMFAEVDMLADTTLQGGQYGGAED